MLGTFRGGAEPPRPPGTGSRGVCGACGRASLARRGCVTRADASLPVGPAAIYSPAHAPSALSARRLTARGGRRGGGGAAQHPPPSPLRDTGARRLGGPAPAPKIAAAKEAAGGERGAVARCHLAGLWLAGPARTSRGLLEVLVNTVTHRRCPPAPLPATPPGPRCAWCRVTPGDPHPLPRRCHQGH